MIATAPLDQLNQPKNVVRRAVFLAADDAVVITRSSVGKIQRASHQPEDPHDFSLSGQAAHDRPIPPR